MAQLDRIFNDWYIGVRITDALLHITGRLWDRGGRNDEKETDYKYKYTSIIESFVTDVNMFDSPFLLYIFRMRLRAGIVACFIAQITWQTFGMQQVLANQTETKIYDAIKSILNLFVI